MRFPQARIPDEDHRLASGDVLTAGQIEHVGFVQTRHRTEIEVGQFPEHREAGLLDPLPLHVLFALAHLLLGQRQQVAHMVLVVAGGVGRKRAITVQKAGQLQLLEIRFEQEVGFHILPPAQQRVVLVQIHRLLTEAGPVGRPHQLREEARRPAEAAVDRASAARPRGCRAQRVSLTTVRMPSW